MAQKANLFFLFFFLIILTSFASATTTYWSDSFSYTTPDTYAAYGWSRIMTCGSSIPAYPTYDYNLPSFAAGYNSSDEGCAAAHDQFLYKQLSSVHVNESFHIHALIDLNKTSTGTTTQWIVYIGAINTSDAVTNQGIGLAAYRDGIRPAGLWTSWAGFQSCNTTFTIPYIAYVDFTISTSLKQYSYLVTLANGSTYSCSTRSAYSASAMPNQWNTAQLNIHMAAHDDMWIFADDYYLDDDLSLITLTTGDPTQTLPDLAITLESQWGDLGLKSTLSKVIFGLLLMIMLTGCLVYIIAKYHVNLPSLVWFFIEIMLMVLLTMVGLFPLWLVIILVIFGVAIFIIGLISFAKQ